MGKNKIWFYIALFTGKVSQRSLLREQCNDYGKMQKSLSTSDQLIYGKCRYLNMV